MLEESTSTVLSHLSHDSHRARERHKHSQPRNARAGALVTHHPAWWLITRVGPGQHPQYTRAWCVRKVVGGSTARSLLDFIQQLFNPLCGQILNDQRLSMLKTRLVLFIFTSFLWSAVIDVSQTFPLFVPGFFCLALS